MASAHPTKKQIEGAKDVREQQRTLQMSNKAGGASRILQACAENPKTFLSDVHPACFI